MDFLKTLLAYVALTVAFSVQEGPLPQDVPTPTPLPPNVTASPIPNAPAATDVPTATPTASPIPEPTITPNMGYKTVQWQDRGSGVLKVQKKLIELGYLAEGEDDGKDESLFQNFLYDFHKYSPQSFFPLYTLGRILST